MRIRLFGETGLTPIAGEPIRFATRKSMLLLAALVLSGPRGGRRDVLSGVLWPDREYAQARASLRQALVDLRRALSANGADSIQIEANAQLIVLTAPLAEIDVWSFDQLLEKHDAASLAAAAELHQADLLAGISLPNQLDDRFTVHRRTYRRKAMQLVERLSLLAETPEQLSACEKLAERLLACDPVSEEAHRALIWVYQRQNRVNAAARQFALCKEVLRRELGVAPEHQTSALLDGRSQTGESSDSRDAPNDKSAGTRPARAAQDRDYPSIVVMPFDNLSGQSDETFVDGVVEEVTATLSRIRDFFVIARQSAFAFKGRFVDVREIGRELGVSYVLEGTVRRGRSRAHHGPVGKRRNACAVLV